LGQLFVSGNNTGLVTPILLGLIFFVGLALIFDLTILLVMRLLTPWRRAAVS